MNPHLQYELRLETTVVETACEICTAIWESDVQGRIKLVMKIINSSENDSSKK